MGARREHLLDKLLVKVVVATESRAGERRVAVVPDVAARLMAKGWEVVIQSGAGARASFTDEAYRAAGATIADAASLYAGAAAAVRVNAPGTVDVAGMPEGLLLLSFFSLADSAEALAALAAKQSSVFSFDLLPRISRAQGMDALSSQATVTGYRAGLIAAEYLPKFFPMFMTAAGTVPPAKVLVLGVGVAGLQAIATARRLGAVVRAYDVRAAAKEEAESLGATFVDLGVSAEGSGGYARQLTDDELARQREALAAEVAASDVLITTAAVPGRRAPVLVTTEMVRAMATGAVVVDVAADSGGNCEPTRAGEVLDVDGTTVVGVSNPPSAMPTHASVLYARNVLNLLDLLGPAGAVDPQWDDEIVAGCCLLRDGRPGNDAVAELLGLPTAGAGSAGAS